MHLRFFRSTGLGVIVLLPVLVCVLAMHAPVWGQSPPAAAKSAKRFDDSSPLRNDAALKVKLTVKFTRPKAQDILERLRAETKLDLTLADNIDREQPVLGSFSGRNVPAWIILEELAKSKIIQGKWERDGNGYRLTSALPPADLANSPSPAGWAKLGLNYVLFALPLLALFGMLLWVRYRRRRSRQAVASSKQPAVQKLSSSV